MITIHLKYVIDPYMVSEFKHYAKLWIPLINKFGGKHHGYFLPSESANNVALALYSFESLAEYEKYREAISHDSECIAASKFAEEKRFIKSYERSFFNPLFE